MVFFGNKQMRKRIGKRNKMDKKFNSLVKK